MSCREAACSDFLQHHVGSLMSHYSDFNLYPRIVPFPSTGNADAGLEDIGDVHPYIPGTSVDDPANHYPLLTLLAMPWHPHAHYDHELARSSPRLLVILLFPP